MAKVYECGFTFSGTSQVDTIGGVTITLDGSAIYQDPLNDFLNRPGWYIDNSSSVPTSNNNVLYFRDTSRSQKSIVIWFRIISGDGAGNLMAGGSTFTRDGLFGQSGNLRFFSDGSVWSTLLPNGVYNDNEWHMVVVEPNFTANETSFYADGAFVNTFSSYLPNNNGMQLGQPECELGLIQVYDTILNATEVENLWNTGLIDAKVQQPLLTLEGTVYDFNNIVISGADVRVFNHATKLVDNIFTTSSGGDYVAYFPTVGEYSLSVSKQAFTGGRSVPITVTSGGYTLYDS